MTKWKCDRAGAICLKPCYAECEGEDCAPDKCLFSEFRTPKWKRVPDESEQKSETTLPDWCKVGEWVYSHGCKEYDLIVTVDDAGIFTKRNGRYSPNYIADGKIVPARLRPWTKKEAIGKVVKNACCVGIITYADKFKCIVGTKVITLKELSEEYTKQDGAPCGKFEHINDAGEWEA